jgi:DNA-binding transcriptional MerR regulator
MKTLDIAQVVAASGHPASTLRYYEELGLIESVGRRGMRRQYERDVLKRLALIAMARSAGFSLEETAPLFSDNSNFLIPREELHLRADDLVRKAREMEALASIMRHVADCPAPSHLECPSFQKLLRIGLKHQSRSRRRRQSMSGRKVEGQSGHLEK